MADVSFGQPRDERRVRQRSMFFRVSAQPVNKNDRSPYKKWAVWELLLCASHGSADSAYKVNLFGKGAGPEML